MVNTGKLFASVLLTSCFLIPYSYGSEIRYYSSDDENVYSYESQSSHEPMQEITSGDLNDLLKQLIKKTKQEISPEELLKKNMQRYIPNVYKLEFGSSLNGESAGHTGTGFLLDAKKGIILTNYHVVPGNEFGIITVVTDKGDEYTQDEVEILSTSVGTQFGDFTFLRVKKLATDNPKSQMPISRIYDLKKHDHVGFIGNSYGSLDIETGQINDLYNYWLDPDYIGGMSFSVNLKARGGASGSPVFDVNGTVVGILFAGDEVHNMIFPMAMVMDYYDQLTRGEKLTARTLGAPLIPEKIQDLSRYHQIPLDELRRYLNADDGNQENRLMVARPHITSKDKDHSLQPEDIILSIDGEVIGPNQTRINALINNSDNHEVEVYRLGEKKTVSIPTITYTQEFAKSIDIDSLTVVSADSSLLERFGVKIGSPLAKLGGFSILGIASDYSLISRVHRTDVATFNDFVKAIHDTYAVQGITTFMVWTSKRDGGSPEAINLDLRGALGKSFFVTEMDTQKHQWRNINYDQFVAREFPIALEEIDFPDAVKESRKRAKKRTNSNC